MKDYSLICASVDKKSTHYFAAAAIHRIAIKYSQVSSSARRGRNASILIRNC